MELARLILEFIQVLIWPSVTLIISFLFKSQIKSLVSRIKTAKLPGGVSLDLNEEIKEVKNLSTKVQESLPSGKKERQSNSPAIPLTEANARLLHLGFRPSPSGMDMNYYRGLAKHDPNLALAGLRIDLDILSRNLAKGFNVTIDENRDSGIRLYKKLLDSGAITMEQYQLVVKVFSVCNKAIHGVYVTFDQALAVINSAEALVDDYLAWLSWGFDDDWEHSKGHDFNNAGTLKKTEE